MILRLKYACFPWNNGMLKYWSTKSATFDQFGDKQIHLDASKHGKNNVFVKNKQINL
jgi:hypothetical protein